MHNYLWGLHEKKYEFELGRLVLFYSETTDLLINSINSLV